MNSQGKKILVKIKRQKNPNPRTTYWSNYKLDANPGDRILDLLEIIRADKDNSLTFRSNCGHGICGSDALNINGSNRLACQTLLGDLGFPDRVVILPMPGFSVEKDLVVNENELEEALINQKIHFVPHEEGKNTSSNIPTEKTNEAVSCIECGSCQSACPITRKEKRFPGPQILTRISRYIFDGRDSSAERIKRINSYCSLWKCQTMYNCVEVCPRQINITALISDLKKEVVEKG